MNSVLGISLPENWGVSRLKHLTNLLNRGSTPTYVDKGSVRAISQAANQIGGLDWSRTRFHDFGGDATKLKGYLQPDDVLINSTGTGTLGRVGFFSGAPDGIPCMADSHVTVARTKSEELHPRFTYYWLGSQPFQDYVYAALVVGATNQIELNRENLGDASVPVPPLEEQRRITKFLDAETSRINGLLQRSTRQLALLQEQFSETMRFWTTVGNDEARPTMIPWMPEMSSDWSLLKVGHQFATGSGTTPTSTVAEYFDGPYWWVNSGDLNDGKITSSEKTITDKAMDDFPALKLHDPGSLVIAMYGQGTTKGKVGVLTNHACVNQACCVLSPVGKISTQYARYWFRAHKEGIVTLAQGAGQPNLSQELIRNLRIPTPDMHEQQRIVSQLTREERQFSRRVHLLRKRENLLTERRQALITAAVTGQINVSTASGRGIEE